MAALMFSKVDTFINSPINCFVNTGNADHVIARGSAKFTCAYCDFSELEKTLNEELSEPITEKAAVTKWLGEKMDLGMAVGGLMKQICE